jgi:C4-type Zn-finger protein
MRIKAFLTQHRNDFTATMECEHCGHTQKLTTGYDDRNYHERVIPSMRCPSCGKNRAGDLYKETEPLCSARGTNATSHNIKEKP